MSLTSNNLTPKSLQLVLNVSTWTLDSLSSIPLDLSVVGTLWSGTAGGTGYVIEYAGEIIKSLSMEERMTICNMTIEAGARAGLIAPDNKTFEYLKDRTMSPKGDVWKKATESWNKLFSDKDCKFDKEVNINGQDIEPLVTWGTSPQDVSPITGTVPDPDKEKTKIENWL